MTHLFLTRLCSNYVAPLHLNLVPRDLGVEEHICVPACMVMTVRDD